jgi:type I restriction enzyme, R subunit
MTRITEDHLEDYVITALTEEQGYSYVYAPDIAVDGTAPERGNYQEVVLVERLRNAVGSLNSTVPVEAREQAIREVLRLGSSDLLTANEKFHSLLTNGVEVSYRHKGEDKDTLVNLIDFAHPERNEFLVANQFTIIENGNNKRPDVIIFINGLPLVVIELKNPADEHATLDKAYNQLQTYLITIPSLFHYNGLLVISDGFEAKAGTISADFSRYMAWKSKDGMQEASALRSQLETLMTGMFKKEVLLDLLRYFIVYEKTSKTDAQTGVVSIETVKKLAAYHQYYAVNKAVTSTIKAAQERSTNAGKAGVVWHTQGSGKSLSMVFYAGKLVQQLNNPTILVITDRNDLDDQLFDTFAASKSLLRQTPVQAESREELQSLLRVAAGGIVFTTIQKFFPDDEQVFPQLSDRRNIVVIADEAHRTQYGFEAKMKFIKDKEGNEVGTRIAYGFAKHMRDALPNATFIGFTGTPVESTDKNTQAVFGDYVDIYDISQAVEDGATVPIYYESRLAKIHLREEELEKIDEELTLAAEDQPDYVVQKEKSKWARLEAIIGEPDRLRSVAQDIVTHFEDREKVFHGKAMVVAMSRRIAVELYRFIIELRPDWHSDKDEEGAIKVIMTGSSSDPQSFQPHIRNKQRRKDIGDRLKDPSDPLKLVIVRDMWLTGFDAPVLHTLYIDKPMQGHNLMQAIARVNRVFGNKPGGLVVDYIGIGTDLKKALKTYTEGGGKGTVADDIAEAVAIMLTKLEVVQAQMHGYDYAAYFGAPIHNQMAIILGAVEHILSLEKGSDRYLREVTALSQAYALCKSTQEASEITEELAFFQAVKARIMKLLGTSTRTGGNVVDISAIMGQMVDRAIGSDGVVDVLKEAGIDRPDVKIFSEEFLEEVRKMKLKNLAAEALRKLLADDVKVRFRRNQVEARKFSDMLKGAYGKYINRFITLVQLIDELVKIARDVKAAQEKGDKLNLTEDEIAFYDALADNESAKEVLGDASLRTMAKLLVQQVRKNVAIDWTIRESARAKLRVIVRRVLREYGYPPDLQQTAVETVLKQAELFAEDWAST